MPSRAVLLFFLSCFLLLGVFANSSPDHGHGHDGHDDHGHQKRQLQPATPPPSDVTLLTNPWIFNATYYSARYPDLSASGITTEALLKAHWVFTGLPGGRRASPFFDPVYYLSFYGDLRDVYGMNLTAGALHFVTLGVGEGRIGCSGCPPATTPPPPGPTTPRPAPTPAPPTPAPTTRPPGTPGPTTPAPNRLLDPLVFNATWYLSFYGDLLTNGVLNPQLAANHWVTIGLPEGRRGAPTFDPPYYLANYPDLGLRFGKNYTLGTLHFVNYGYAEGRIGCLGCTPYQPPPPTTPPPTPSPTPAPPPPTPSPTPAPNPLLDPLLFRATYYLARYPDLGDWGITTGEAAASHWLATGLGEGRRASPTFDSIFYLSNYPDVKRVVGTNYTLAALHFLTYGVPEGRIGCLGCFPIVNPGSPAPTTSSTGTPPPSRNDLLDPLVFNPYFYLGYNQDLTQFGVTTPVRAISHWLNTGASEGRRGSSTFDAIFYLSYYPEIRAIYGNDYVAAILHFVRVGASQGRIGCSGCFPITPPPPQPTPAPTPAPTTGTPRPTSPPPPNKLLNPLVFNSTFYLGYYPDLWANSSTNTTGGATAHWLSTGAQEGRRGAQTFDSQYYWASYGDLRAAFGTNYTALIIHFVDSGAREGRIGCLGCPPIIFTTPPPTTPPPSTRPPPTTPPPPPTPAPTLPNPLLSPLVFDPRWYLSQYPDLAKNGYTTIAQATTHWLANGIPEGRRGAPTFDPVWYLQSYSDLSSSFGTSPNRFSLAITHFVNFGSKEGRIGCQGCTPVTLTPPPHTTPQPPTPARVYPTWWVTWSPWMVNLTWTPTPGTPTPLTNKLQDPIIFNPNFYLNFYPDLSKNGILTPAQATSHWLTTGLPEGRRGSATFDPFWYLKNYSDLPFSGPDRFLLAVAHYLDFGIKEGRVPCSGCQPLPPPSPTPSPTPWWLSWFTRPPVTFAPGSTTPPPPPPPPPTSAPTPLPTPPPPPPTPTTPNPLLNPLIFNATYYLSQYSDLSKNGVTTPDQATSHWLASGVQEGRRGSATFDPAWYLRTNPDLWNISFLGNDLYSAVIVHWLTYGIREGRLGCAGCSPVTLPPPTTPQPPTPPTPPPTNFVPWWALPPPMWSPWWLHANYGTPPPPPMGTQPPPPPPTGNPMGTQSPPQQPPSGTQQPGSSLPPPPPQPTTPK